MDETDYFKSLILLKQINVSKRPLENHIKNCSCSPVVRVFHKRVHEEFH